MSKRWRRIRKTDDMRIGFYLLRIPDNNPANARGYNPVTVYGYADVDAQKIVVWMAENVTFPLRYATHYYFVKLPQGKE